MATMDPRKKRLARSIIDSILEQGSDIDRGQLPLSTADAISLWVPNHIRQYATSENELRTLGSSLFLYLKSISGDRKTDTEFLEEIKKRDADVPSELFSRLFPAFEELSDFLPKSREIPRLTSGTIAERVFHVLIECCTRELLMDPSSLPQIQKSVQLFHTSYPVLVHEEEKSIPFEEKFFLTLYLREQDETPTCHGAKRRILNGLASDKGLFLDFIDSAGNLTDRGVHVVANHVFTRVNSRTGNPMPFQEEDIKRILSLQEFCPDFEKIAAAAAPLIERRILCTFAAQEGLATDIIFSKDTLATSPEHYPLSFLLRESSGPHRIFWVERQSYLFQLLDRIDLDCITVPLRRIVQQLHVPLNEDHLESVYLKNESWWPNFNGDGSTTITVSAFYGQLTAPSYLSLDMLADLGFDIPQFYDLHTRGISSDLRTAWEEIYHRRGNEKLLSIFTERSEGPSKEQPSEKVFKALFHGLVKRTWTGPNKFRFGIFCSLIAEGVDSDETETILAAAERDAQENPVDPSGFLTRFDSVPNKKKALEALMRRVDPAIQQEFVVVALSLYQFVHAHPVIDRSPLEHFNSRAAKLAGIRAPSLQDTYSSKRLDHLQSGGELALLTKALGISSNAITADLPLTEFSRYALAYPYKVHVIKKFFPKGMIEEVSGNVVPGIEPREYGVGVDSRFLMHAKNAQSPVQRDGSRKIYARNLEQEPSTLKVNIDLKWLSQDSDISSGTPGKNVLLLLQLAGAASKERIRMNFRFSLHGTLLHECDIKTPPLLSKGAQPTFPALFDWPSKHTLNTFEECTHLCCMLSLAARYFLDDQT